MTLRKRYFEHDEAFALPSFMEPCTTVPFDVSVVVQRQAHQKSPEMTEPR